MPMIGTKKTIMTITAPVQIPTTTLQPGTYTIKLLRSDSDRHIVTVWNEDGTRLITTILAIPNTRLEPTGKTKFTFWETPADQPKALRAWFYPGDNFGQEFAYPKAKAQQLSAVTHSTVPELEPRDEEKYGGGKEETAAVTPEPAAPAPAPEPKPAPVEPAPTPAPVAAAPAPEPTPAPEPAPAAPEPAPAQADQTPAPQPSTMPQTASNWNEMMAAGFLLALIGLSTFAFRSKKA